MSPRPGVQALAYPISNPTSPCLCSLVFRCDATRKRATLLLVTAKWTLQYDAENLLSGTVSLVSGSQLEREKLDELSRNKTDNHSDIKTLTLSTQRPCPVWCRQSPDALPHSELDFLKPGNLTGDAPVHIVFDFKHVRKEHQGMFKAFSKAARGLVGYPVEGFLTDQGLSRISYGVLAPGDAVGAPPAYECDANSSSPCRSPGSATGSQSSEKTLLSPGAGAALLRAPPRHVHLDSTQALGSEAIELAEARNPPAYVEPHPQSKTVEAAIGDYLHKALPNLLATLVAGAMPNSDPSSPATSSTSFDSLGNAYPKLPPLTPLGEALIPHLTKHLAEQLRQHQDHQMQLFERLVHKTFDHVERAGHDAHEREMAELDECLEDHRLELLMMKNESIDDLQREQDKILMRNKEESRALAENIDGELSGLCDKINRLKKMKLRRMVRREVSKQIRKKPIAKGVSRSPRRTGRGLLGRRRKEAEVTGWVND